MPIPRAPSTNHLFVGGALLAFWLGWAAVALAYLQPSPLRPGDADDIAPLLADVLARLPAASGNGPLAVRLQPACACDDRAEPAWQALTLELRTHGGSSLTLQDVADTGTHEVLILAAGYRPVYAGPLVPDPALCGGGTAETRLRQWLPQLLARPATPLIANAACSCPPSDSRSTGRLPS